MLFLRQRSFCCGDQKSKLFPRYIVFCQLTEDTLSGPPGLSVMSRVVMELNCAVAPAPIRRPRTMEHRAKNILKNHEYVLLRTAPG